MCTNTLETERSKGYYGHVKTDAMFTKDDMTESYYNNNSLLHRTDDCLLFWDNRFSEGKHNLTLEPDKYLFLLKRFDVISIEGGNNTQPSTNPSGETNTGNKSSGGSSLSNAVIIGIVVAAVIVFISSVTYCLRRCRARRPQVYISAAQPQFITPTQNNNVVIVHTPMQQLATQPHGSDEDPNKYLVTPSAAPPQQVLHQHLPYQQPTAYQQPYQHAVAPVPVPSLPSPRPKTEPAVHYPGQNAPYNPFGVERHQPQAIPTQHSQHVSSQPMSTPPVPSPYSAPSTLATNNSRDPASSDMTPPPNRTTSPDSNLASHFAGRTVLAADGTYNYAGGARPTKEPSYSAPVTRPQAPQAYGFGAGPSASVAPVPTEPARSNSQPQSQYQQYQAQQQQPTSQPSQRLEQPMQQQQFQPGHAPQASADIPDLPPPMYEENAARR